MQYVLTVTVPSLMTFTWPGDVPLMALWRGSSGQVRRNGLTGAGNPALNSLKRVCVSPVNVING